jgi:hypothetical protein
MVTRQHANILENSSIIFYNRSADPRIRAADGTLLPYTGKKKSKSAAQSENGSD